MYTIKATFTGLVHMMMNRFFEAITTEPGGSRRKGDADREADIIRALHINPKTKCVAVPADNIKMMLVGNQARPGAAKIMGSYREKQKGTEYKTNCDGSIWVMGRKDPLWCELLPARKIYDEIDERAFVTQKGKGGSARKIARRPLLTLPWHVPFLISVTDDNVTSEWVRDIFRVAGLYCGICAYGPKFGRCEITEWEIVDTPKGRES